MLGGALIGAIAASRIQTMGAAAGYSLAFLIMGIISLILVGISFKLKNRAAEQNQVLNNETQID